MSIGPKRRQYVQLCVTPRCRERLVHPLCKVGTEIGVVLGVNPKHRNARGLAEVACRGDELIRPTISVRLAINATTAPCGKGDNRTNRRRIKAGECDGSPATP